MTNSKTIPVPQKEHIQPVVAVEFFHFRKEIRCEHEGRVVGQ